MGTNPATAIGADLLAELRDDPATLAELRRLLGTGSPTVYSCATLAAELGCTPRAVRAAIERGDLVAARSGGRYVIAADAVVAWATPVGTQTPTRVRRTRSRTMREALDRAGLDSRHSSEYS